MYLLECNKLDKKYGSFQALDGIDLKIGPGKIIGLLGPNGSGKTTLIKIVNGLLQPSSGEVLIKGEKPGVNSKKIISYLPDRQYFNNKLKVSQTLDLFKDFYEDFNYEKAENLIKSFNISLSKKLSELSKGMYEKVQLALVVSRDAELYIFDEPIAGVDPASRDVILETIFKNFKEGSSVIISSHLIADIEDVLDEVYFLKEGTILLHGEVKELKEKYDKSIDGIFREVFRWLENFLNMN